MADRSSKKKPPVPEKDRDLRLKNALRANLKLRKTNSAADPGDQSAVLRRDRPLRARGTAEED